MKSLNKTIIAVALTSIVGASNATLSTLDADGTHVLYIDETTKEVIVVGGTTYFNETGDYAVPGQNIPVPYGVGNAISVVAKGFRSLVLTSDGTVWVSGREHGRTPIQLSFTNVLDLAATGEVVQVIINGVLYEQNLTDGTEPYIVEGLPSNIVEVSSDFYHSVARTADGLVYTWGGNTQGQLGDGTRIDNLNPKLLEGLPVIQHISASERNTVLTDINGDVWVMGEGRNGQAGNGTDYDELSPYKLPISNPENVAKGYAGRSFTAVHFKDGSVSMVGWHNLIGTSINNGYIYNRSYELVQIPELSDVTDVAITGKSRHFRLSNGDLVAWGGNGYGQLGNGLYIETHYPDLMLDPIYPEGYVVEYDPTNVPVYPEVAESEPIFESETTLECGEPETIVEVQYIEKIVEVEVPVVEYVEVIKYVYKDHDNGHGNDEGKFDTSNPGKKSNKVK